MRRGPPQSGLSLVLSLGARRRRPGSFDLFQEPPRPFSRERSLRKLFETVVARYIREGVVGGEAFAVDASMIVADAYRRRGVSKIEDLDPTSSRAVAEYLFVLDDAAFGGATPVEPKSISPTDPAARYTAAADTPAVYACSDNYLVSRGSSEAVFQAHASFASEVGNDFIPPGMRKLRKPHRLFDPLHVDDDGRGPIASNVPHQI